MRVHGVRTKPACSDEWPGSMSEWTSRIGPWIVSAQMGGTLVLPGLDISMPLADLYQGLSFPA